MTSATSLSEAATRKLAFEDDDHGDGLGAQRFSMSTRFRAGLAAIQNRIAS